MTTGSPLKAQENEVVFATVATLDIKYIEYATDHNSIIVAAIAHAFICKTYGVAHTHMSLCVRTADACAWWLITDDLFFCASG